MAVAARPGAPPLETVHSGTPAEDARRLLAGFLPRALRRPVPGAEVEPYVALVGRRLAAGDCFEDAMRRTYVAILTSPEFLFHPADSPATAAPDCCAIASRIAYWLWNSPPDAPLLAAAGDGSLARAFTAHMIRYATGADITYADRRVIEDILDTAAPTQYGLRSILHAIAAWLESPHAKAMP